MSTASTIAKVGRATKGRKIKKHEVDIAFQEIANRTPKGPVAVPPLAGGTHPKAKGSTSRSKGTKDNRLPSEKIAEATHRYVMAKAELASRVPSGTRVTKPKITTTEILSTGSSSPAPRTQIRGRSRAFTKAHAAGAGVGAAMIAAGSTNRGDGSMASQSTSTTVSKPPSGNSDLTEVRVNARRRSTPSTPTGGTPKKAPQARTGASRGGSSASPSRGPAKGQSMADYLGLSKDSAVRHYMDTGQHKYPVKGSTSAVKSGKGRTKAK